MTSRPLFMSVAESMVILAPIVQVGWARASAGRRRRPCAPRDQLAERAARGGQDEPLPPGQVLAHQALPDGRVLRIDGPQPGQRGGHRRGRIGRRTAAARALASGMTRWPPATSVSLLAVATTLPAARAASTGRRLTTPPVATMTRSTSSRVAISTRASSPGAAIGCPRAAAGAPPHRGRPARRPSGRSAAAWALSVSASRPAARATTWKASAPAETSTSRVCRPIEPVDPRSATPTLAPGGRCAAWQPPSRAHDDQVAEDHGRREEEGVDAIEDAAVAGDEVCRSP